MPDLHAILRPVAYFLFPCSHFSCYTIVCFNFISKGKFSLTSGNFHLSLYLLFSKTTSLLNKYPSCGQVICTLFVWKWELSQLERAPFLPGAISLDLTEIPVNARVFLHSVIVTTNILLSTDTGYSCGLEGGWVRNLGSLQVHFYNLWT